MWEYDRIEFTFKKGSELTNKLNELGLLKWEVISCIETPPKIYGKESHCVILVKRLNVRDERIIL